MAEQAVRPSSSDAAGAAPAGAPSTSSSPPSSASPSASSSGRGTCFGALAAPLRPLPAAPGGHVRRLPDARRRRAAASSASPAPPCSPRPSPRRSSPRCSARPAAAIIVVYGLVQGAGAASSASLLSRYRRFGWAHGAAGRRARRGLAADPRPASTYPVWAVAAGSSPAVRRSSCSAACCSPASSGCCWCAPWPAPAR